MKSVKVSDLRRVHEYAMRYDVRKNGHLSPLQFITLMWNRDEPIDRVNKSNDLIQELWGVILEMQILDPEMEKQ